ncbi:MAG TPA: GAF domain-containing protein, partial [Thermomicrobiales bacterium]|nr:GAF domain-containing protein [Thermomicrobiales bacterium]
MIEQSGGDQELRRELERLRARVVILERVDAERQEIAERLREETRVSESLHRVGVQLAAELDTQRLVQIVTDEATGLTGAEFGAFFYNVINDEGESYTLYTISGVDPAAFAAFPMPRNTQIFGPTFRGEGVLRIDDVTQDARYGNNPPYHGMPPGHLPVRSYLAVPVISRGGDVLGGLFFGHTRAGMFTERAERLAVGIASQAAIAIDNARLYSEAQDAHARYSYLFEGMADAILLANNDSRYIDVNPAAELMLGYSRSELLDMQVADIVTYQRAWTEAELEHFQRDGVWTGEVELRHKDGHHLPVEARASRVGLPDGVVF